MRRLPARHILHARMAGSVPWMRHLQQIGDDGEPNPTTPEAGHHPPHGEGSRGGLWRVTSRSWWSGVLAGELAEGQGAEE